jgi:hypothetical protein
MYFGRSGQNRFDAPHGEDGVLYLAADVRGAFIETFGRDHARTAIDWYELHARTISEITTSRPLRLVDLTGSGLTRIGADGRLATGAYDLSQRWALALHEHPDQPDGLLDRSRHDPERLCAAIFDRAAHALAATSSGSLTDTHNAMLLADILDTYDYSLIGP